MRDRSATKPSDLAVPGAVLGVGLGGFVDGIVFHRLLQWHHFISDREDMGTVAGLEENSLADGLIDVVFYGFIIAGLVLLWRAGGATQLVGRGVAFVGWVLIGWGAFNVFDSAVLHLVLQLHHLREGPDALAYDIGYIVSGIVLALVGSALVRRNQGSIGRDRPSAVAAR